jgi:hypothetical protein
MENYYPRRLTYIQVEDMCMFCINPKGKTLTYTVYPEMLMGYISCPNCASKAEEAIKIWNEKLAYGRLNYLKGKDIRIKRSSGDIEYGWIMDNPIVCFSSHNGRETIHCYNQILDIGKNCYIDDLLILNPPEKKQEHIQKNLCINCGIDMGECNPRQYCGKWECPNEEGKYLNK